MPEIKNTFLQGKMNKDLDERLIPNGQYRDALNVEVSTSEGSDVGTVKNILGNQRVENLVGSNFKCVGSVADEKNNKLYWFISKYNVDAILEYDANNDIAKYVLVDIYAGTSKAVLKFFGNIITGINIIDNLLFWTDNQGEPKKINIDTCKAGTTGIDAHTQLSFENGSFHGITIRSYMNPATVNRYFYYPREKFLKAINTWVHAPSDSNNDTVMRSSIRHYRNGKLLGTYDINFFNSTNWPNPDNDPIVSNRYTSDSINYIEDSNYPGIIPHESGGYPGTGTWGRRIWSEGSVEDFSEGDVIFGDNVTIDIAEKHVTVIKPKPLKAPTVKINHTESTQSTSKIPNLFETKFPRFSYRYKYRDGEYSTFAPFTEPVFNAKYTKDTSKSIDGGVMYNQDTAYDIKEPYNKAMVNAIHSVDLTDFITAQTPEDVVEIDILYKQENSSIIYSIDTIKHVDSEWHDWSNSEGTNIGYGKALQNADSYAATGGLTGGKYIVTTENIYAALPANQLLRPWDNVPRKALAQEVTGNRIVYGNYLQNYDIGSKPQVQVSYSDRQNRLGTFTSKGLPSIKSQRNYQLGVVYCDKYGRETPVFTSNDGAVNIPWQDSSGKKNASKSTQLTVGAVNNFPEWVDSLKFFVKETSNEYYNLTMERAWVTKSTYELDNSEGHLWISFPSSDRNKISEEDYIILKKKIGVGEEQVTFENKFKVVDIKNEAPDAIKYDLVNYGHVRNKVVSGSHFFAELFPNGYRRIDREVDTINMVVEEWADRGDATGVTSIGSVLPEVLGQVPLEEDADGGHNIKTKDLYMSWSRVETDGETTSSKKYKIISGRIRGDYYQLKLSTKISKIDADIAHETGNSTNSTTSGANFKENLIFQIEKRELKEEENFSGKFFVKISKNQVSSIIETGKEVSNLDKYQVTAKQGVWNWHDDIMTVTGSPIVGDNDYGLTNNFGFDANHSTSGSDPNHVHYNYTDSNGNNNTSADTSYNSQPLRISDWWEVWNGIRNELDNKPRFFVDSMYMAAGQSEASDYAKYCCITWSGCTKDDGGDTAENSAWSYPPLKTWLSEFGDTSNLITPVNEVETSDGAVQIIPATSSWYENNLISTSPILNGNSDYENLKIDGWVGPLQNVSRDLLIGSTAVNNHINGLEGLVTTNEFHATGPRRWFSGLNGTDYGVGSDTKTYSDNGEEDRHFMHLSFFAPGKDLHDGVWAGHGGNSTIGRALYGETGFMAYLQGIWGGGVFTGETPGQTFGSNGDYTHLAMEGNYDDAVNYLSEPPGPGVGFGYDLDYRELHERQWDPTFLHDSAGLFVGDPGNKIRDFIRNLYPGSKFRFNKTNSGSFKQIDDAVYTIKKVTIKKLYNHTSWRKPYNRYIDGQGYDIETTQHLAYQSVEEVALDYLNQLNSTGSSTGGSSYSNNVKDKIEQFGANHNRRLCYIIELDKNPAEATGNIMGNPLDMNNGNHDGMSGDLANSNFTDVEFLDPVQDLLLSDLSKFPAIWEVDPKKQEVDLDIYYEASNNIPVRINEKTNELFAPIGCKVEIINATPQQALNDVYLESWDGAEATFYPGFNRGDGNNEIDYTNTAFKFIREDGSYTVAEAGGQQLIGALTGFKTNFVFKEDIGGVIGAGLAWYNCFSFGNGLESNRIRDDFNEMFITNGVKASTTTQQTYEEERRSHGLIYSGIYNSNSGINDLNQFIMAEKITKDLNPTYGSIQKLFQRRISLIAFCEDRVIQITSNKDAIYNADGNPQLISSSNVLGDANPFVGNFGISKNPESFASESYRAYFTDKARGAVLRLSKDGLTPISKAGMHDWFRDNLPIYTSLIGTYDSYKENYNITLSNTYTENIIFNTSFGQGLSSTEVDVLNLNVIDNGLVGSGDSYTSSLNTINFPDDSTFDFGNSSSVFKNTVTVTNHAEIPFEYFQTGTEQPDEIIATENIDQAAQAFQQAIYEVTPGNDDGWWYDPRFADVSNDLFGPSSYTLADPQVFSTIKRVVDNVGINESNPGPDFPTSGWATGYDPSVEKLLGSYPFFSGNYATGFSRISEAITRTTPGNPGSDGAVLFDRANPSNSYVEFKNIGDAANYPPGGGVNDDYWNANPVGSSTAAHARFYNGDEIHIQLVITCYVTLDGTTDNDKYYGYNFIEPTIELYDGNHIVNPDKLKIYDSFGAPFFGGLQSAQDANGGVYNPYAYQQTTAYDMGGDFENFTALTDIPSSYSSAKAIGYMAASSSAVTFPSTHTISSLNGTTSSDVGVVQVVVGASFKFIDPNQQSPNGTPIVSGANIEEVKVIDDLRIRVSNAKPAASSGYVVTGQTNYSLRNPIWEINKMFIKKGFGVVAPHVPEIQEIITFDNPNTGAVEQYTTAQLQADTNAEFVSGQWILNYGDIQAYQGGGGSYLPPVPSITIPAWVEVQHSAITEWTFDNNVGTGAGYNTSGTGQWITSKTNHSGSNWFGNNNQGTDFSEGGFTFRVPPGFDINTGADTQTGNAHDWPFNQNGLTLGDNNTFTAQGSGTAGNPVPKTYSDVKSDYLRIGQSGTSGSTAYSIHCALGAGEEYVVGATADDNWYFVDLEYADNASDNDNKDINDKPDVGDRLGTGTSHDGMVYIPGVADGGLFGTISGGDPVNGNGVGLLSGSSAVAHVTLVPTWRTEYGDNRWVLRAIYQVHPSSEAANHLDYFSLRFYNFKNHNIYVNKIISKKINYVNGTGTATNWDINFDSGIYDQLHTFSDGVYNSSTDDHSNMYYHSNRLCWENVYHPGSEWIQTFQNVIPTTASGQDPNWTLKFTVGPNPRYGNFSGELGLRVTNSLGDNNDPLKTNDFDGIKVDGIVQEGEYEVTFGMNGAVDGNTNWTLYRDGDITIQAGTVIAYNASTTNSDASEQIAFYNNNGSVALNANVSGITLTNQTQLFEGGTVASWNFDGFEPTIDDYIIWDGDNSTDGRIQFQNCPTFDPNATGVAEIITANQLIDKPINRYEKYEISFTYKMTDIVNNPGSGLLHMYYFNSEGYGFRIQDIGDINNSNIVDTRAIDNSTDEGDGVRKVTMTVGIGDGSTTPSGYTGTIPWDTASSELAGQGVEALLNTFVVRRDASDSDNVTGWVDNISMKRVYDIELNDDGTLAYPPTTVTFSEDVNGWTSFKSFVPEAGLSLSKKYFTLKDAALYQHYVPANGATAATAENYNTFYGTFDELIDSSTITTVLNAEPSVIKMFNTLNYEGSQAHVTKPLAAVDQFGNSTITINNAKAWSSGSDIDGWKVTEVKTDMDNGNLQSFIKKEGKWFGYIKGKRVAADTLDTSRFSVQGIGFASYITETTTTTTTGTAGGGGGGVSEDETY